MAGLLQLGDARGEAMLGLSALVEQRGVLERKLDQLDTDQRQASEDVERAAAELVDLEQRSAGGGDVSDSERTKLEKQLASARARAASPWAERNAGVQEALRRHDDATSRFIGQNIDELLAELDVDAERLAAAVNAAAAVLVTAYHDREAHASRVSALCSLIGNVRPGDIARTRSEPLAREATKLLQGGGEPPPVVLHRPGQPRHGVAKVDEEAGLYAPEPA